MLVCPYPSLWLPHAPRLAERYVQLFVEVGGPHKDAFFRRYFDGLAQAVFYAMQIVSAAAESLCGCGDLFVRSDLKFFR